MTPKFLDVAHISNWQIKELLDALPQTQVSALETQAEPSQAIMKPPTGMGLAGGDRNKSPLHEDIENPVLPQKCHIDTLNPIPTISKCVRIATAEQDNGSATEDEDEEFEIRVHRRHQEIPPPPADCSGSHPSVKTP
ncbi:hypothetical protein FRC08_016678 [Ceratobasidium sp. 394]|nr:hypothetical protein FRC08_016678 [Ceratobasidium sp. 394]KAG9087387.1 hypothetical protein FS749_002946 [Ceratobasidium sp. UAMH 11750]